jgi:replication factor C subunit 3/5
MNKKTYIPWVEKYRPSDFDNIVLSDENKKIFNNIFKKNYMPNLLLYGPPGTGKTTTVINLINKYQKANNQENKGLMIHLNASDERGIDIIRNQINNFVNSKTIFSEGVKFIILDEVDYMTKNAQQALKYLLQEYQKNIRFCLICNYVSKIDESLQNEFIKLRFNQLPKEDIINFLSIINENEKLKLTRFQLETIHNTYKSDMRGMINYMQSNQLAIYNTKVIDNVIFSNIDKLINNNDNKKFNKYFNEILSEYNIDLDTIIKQYCNYIIKIHIEKINSNILKKIEYIIHNIDMNQDYKINLLYYSLCDSFSS